MSRGTDMCAVRHERRRVQAAGRNALRANCRTVAMNEKEIEGEAFDNAKLCSGAPTGAGVGRT